MMEQLESSEEVRERADTREADSRELLPPATEGDANPSDQPVTGSASPSATDNQRSSFVTSLEHPVTKEPIWPIIAAVLASEQVVDPEEHAELLQFAELHGWNRSIAAALAFNRRRRWLT